MPKSFFKLIHTNQWIIPALIFFLLIFAWFTRWEHIEQKSFDNGVTYAYKIDNWTGETWLEKSRADEYQEAPVINGKIDKLDSEFRINQARDQADNLLAEESWQKRILLNNIWYGSAAITIIWLIIALRKRQWLL